MQSPPWPEQSKQGGGFFSPSKALALSRRFLAGVFGNALVVDDASRRKSVGFLAGRAPRRDRPEAAGQRRPAPAISLHHADQTGRLNFSGCAPARAFHDTKCRTSSQKINLRRPRSRVPCPRLSNDHRHSNDRRFASRPPTVASAIPELPPTSPRGSYAARSGTCASSEKLTFSYLGATSGFLPSSPLDLPQ